MSGWPVEGFYDLAIGCSASAIDKTSSGFDGSFGPAWMFPVGDVLSQGLE